MAEMVATENCILMVVGGGCCCCVEDEVVEGGVEWSRDG